MLHKTGKPEVLVGSYRPLSLTSCLGKLLEKGVDDNISNWAEANKSFNKQQENGFRKKQTIYLKKVLSLSLFCSIYFIC